MAELEAGDAIVAAFNWVAGLLCLEKEGATISRLALTAGFAVIRKPSAAVKKTATHKSNRA